MICLVIWSRAGKLAVNPGGYRIYGWLAFLEGIAIGVIVMVCLLAVGVGHHRGVRGRPTLAAVVSLGFLVWGVIQMWRGMRRALAGEG